MKLQKLVYIAYGFYSAFRDEMLFPDTIQAWEYGPVIPKLYHELKRYGFGAVLEPIPFAVRSGELDQNGPEYNVIKGVWDAYKQFEAIELSSLTHQDGSPWSTARKAGNGAKNIAIPFETIRDHYREMINARKQRPEAA